jgi:hypothetical protein
MPGGRQVKEECIRDGFRFLEVRSFKYNLNLRRRK